MTALTLLFDTNAFYALEDVSAHRQHSDAAQATRLKELAQKQGCRMVLHPSTRDDINATNNERLRQASTLKMRQWDILGRPNERTTLAAEAGYVEPLSRNDSVDLGMLAALDTAAADILITQDRKLRGHAAQLGYGDRALTIQAGIEYLERLAGTQFSYPTVEQRKAYEISIEDPIFASLRADYGDFDGWFEKACREHRDCFVVGQDHHMLTRWRC